MEFLSGNVSRLSADIFLTIWPASTWHGCVLSISVQRSSSDYRLAEDHQWVARSPWLISNHRNHRYLSPFLSLSLSLSFCLCVSQAWISLLCAFFSWYGRSTRHARCFQSSSSFEKKEFHFCYLLPPEDSETRIVSSRMTSPRDWSTPLFVLLSRVCRFVDDPLFFFFRCFFHLDVSIASTTAFILTNNFRGM